MNRHSNSFESSRFSGILGLTWGSPRWAASLAKATTFVERIRKGLGRVTRRLRRLHQRINIKIIQNQYQSESICVTMWHVSQSFRTTPSEQLPLQFIHHNQRCHNLVIIICCIFFCICISPLLYPTIYIVVIYPLLLLTHQAASRNWSASSCWGSARWLPTVPEINKSSMKTLYAKHVSWYVVWYVLLYASYIYI